MTSSHSSNASAKLAFGGLLAMAAAMGIGRFVYTPILPFMVDGLSLSSSHAGLVASANFLGYLIGALAASFGALPGTPRTWFLAALLISAVTTGAMGQTDSNLTFMALRFVGGFASAFTLVFSSALVLERLAASGRSGFSALHFAGVGCGISFSAILVSVLGSHGYGWQELWYASAIATLVLFVGAALLVPATAPSTPAASHATGNAKTSGPLKRLIVAYGLFGFGYVITATFISVIVKEQAALQSLEPYIWLIVGLSAIPSIYFWNLVATRTGSARAFSIGALAQALGVGLSVSGFGPGFVVLGALLLGGTFMGMTAHGLVEARSLTSGNPRSILALMTASFGVGQVIGPWVAGELRHLTGSYTQASLIAAASLVAAAALTAR